MYQLSRYLYELSEVKGNLILALLGKDNDKALFWALEYYYSGFPCQVVNFVIQIYYDFYYVLNPTFEKYMFVQLKKVSLVNEYEELALFLKLIIDNLIHRPYTLDVYLLRNIGLQFDVIFDEIKDINSEILSLLFEKDNYIYLSCILMQHPKFQESNQLEYLHGQIIDEMVKYIKINKKVKMTDTATIFKKCYKQEETLRRTIILAKTVNYYSLTKCVKMHRPVYIENNIEQRSKELLHYKTTYPTTLKDDAKYASNNQDFIGIFHLERFKKENEDFRHKYLNNWEFYAYNSPYWNNIFVLYGLHKDEVQQKVIVEDEDEDEDIHCEFYDDIHYFPDEESLETQNKSIGIIEKGCVKLFYEKYGIRNIIQIEEQYMEDLQYFVI